MGLFVLTRHESLSATDTEINGPHMKIRYIWELSDVLEKGKWKSSLCPEWLWIELSGWGGDGGGGRRRGGGGRRGEPKLELTVSFSEISLSDASSSTHILTAAACLVTALLGPSNNIHVHFR